MEPATAYRFGHFRLLPARRQLLAGDLPVKLGSRAFDLLQVLVERRDRTVGKHELMQLVWPSLVVEENNLQVHIVALRKLLGHPAIATVPGRGYRFTLPVSVDGDEATAPATAGPAAAPTLFGRDDDLRTLNRLLDDHAVVTVAGAGGIGKTRLAQGVAADRLSREPDGVWWVELAPLSDPALVPGAVARALGLALENAPDALPAVLAALRGRSALIVLDNAEHLLDGVAAFIGALRQGAAGVRLLVTSQEVLRTSDEQVFRPGPLALPVDDDLAAAQTSGAVALFVARAQAADPRFRLDDSNRAAVVDICRRLDGIPLAIELAAARVPLLGVAGLRARLDERFHVLTAGARAVLRRHQTLRAALEWSHALLSDGERVVFRRLGVFAGGFTIEAAQALAEDDMIDGWDVLEQLGGLVDKSLVVADDGNVPRYRLLETSRLYALERLAEAGETDPWLRRHAGDCMALAEAQDAAIVGHGQGADAVAALDRERDNLLHALNWCDQAGDDDAAAIGLRLAAALRYYWPSCALMPLGARLTERALARAATLPPDLHRAKALASAAQLNAWTGQRAKAEALCSELMALATHLDDPYTTAIAHLHAGQLAGAALRHAEAERHFEAAASIGRDLQHLRLQGNALSGRIGVLRRSGRLDEVDALHEQLLDLKRRDGHGYNLALTLLNCAAHATERGQLAQARRWLLEALPWVHAAGSRLLRQSWVDAVPPLLARCAAWAPMVQLVAASGALLDELGVSAAPADLDQQGRDLQAARAALGDAAFDAEWARGLALDHAAAFAAAVQALQAQP